MLSRVSSDPFLERHPAPLRAPQPTHPSPLALGVETAAVAAAATAGTLVRFAWSSGIGPLGSFAQVGRLVIGVAATDGAAAQLAAAVAGVLVHVALVTVWSLAFAMVAGGWRGARLWSVAVVTSLVAWAVGVALLPPVLRLGHGARALPPQVLLLHAVLALSLGVGMRLAQLRRHETR